MKDRPGLLDDAQRIAEAGRKGDKIIAHINPEEAALLKARGGSGTVNPKTGLLEFWDPSDPGDSGPPSADPGGPASGMDMLPGEPTIDGKPTNAQTSNPGNYADFSSTPGESYADALRNGYQPRGFFERAFDYVGRGVSNGLYDMMNNPARTGINALTSLTGLGIPNTIAGFFNPDMTIGGLATSAARSLTNYDGKPSQTTSAISEPSTGPTSPGDTPADSSGFTGSNPVQQPASANFAGQDPNKVAQEALRRAFMVNPGLLNSWTGNQFTVAGTAGRPNAYNQWQGNQLIRPPVFPGLIG